MLKLTTSSAGKSSSVVRPAGEHRPRAERRTPAETSWNSTIHLGSGQDIRVLNISSSGMLLESGSKLTPNSVTQIRLTGPDSEIVIPAFFVRSEIAGVSAIGVKYHIGVTFGERLQFPTARRRSDDAATIAEPKETARQLQAQVSADLDQLAKNVQSGRTSDWLERATDTQLDRARAILAELKSLQLTAVTQPERID